MYLRHMELLWYGAPMDDQILKHRAPDGSFVLSRLSGRADMHVTETPNGKRRVALVAKDSGFIDKRTWETAYPIALIEAIYATKGSFSCDEIMREEDPRYVENSIRKEVLAYVEPLEFSGSRILDFGCGAGASTIVLSRLLPPCDIVGVELQERLLKIARLRAEHFAKGRISFFQSPSPDRLPRALGQFDYVLFSAVLEHLLPAERAPLLRLVWNHMKPGAILFLNQTPHRYSPVELHTTFLPFINYLPDRLACRMARLSKRCGKGATWEELLRAGIRGGTVSEVMGILRRYGEPALLDPLAAVGDRIDLWYSKLSARRPVLKRGIWALLKAQKFLTGVELMPELSLAIRKMR